MCGFQYGSHPSHSFPITHLSPPRWTASSKGLRCSGVAQMGLTILRIPSPLGNKRGSRVSARVKKLFRTYLELVAKSLAPGQCPGGLRGVRVQGPGLGPPDEPFGLGLSHALPQDGSSVCLPELLDALEVFRHTLPSGRPRDTGTSVLHRMYAIR
jgi:hypothetical protein